MIIISDNTLFHIRWKILRGGSATPEDLTRALLKVWLTTTDNRIPAVVTVNADNLDISVPSALLPGTYGLRAVWFKNHTDLPDMRCVQMTRVDNVFAITDVEEEATNDGENMVINVKSHVATYGYDGLDAYELGILRGSWTSDEKTWLASKYGQLLHGSHLVDSSLTTAKLADGSVTVGKLADDVKEFFAKADGSHTGGMTEAEKTKLAGIEAGATVGATAEQVARIAALESGVLDKVDISQLVDMETKTHAAATYQEKGSYLTEHQDISGKVDKVEGKGLSSNDYTDTDKQKLAGIEDMVSASVEIERQRALSAENDVAGRIPVAISQEIQGEDNVRYPFRSAAMEKFSLTLKNATTESHGLMSKSDKQKLDGFTFDAENGTISFGGKTFRLTEVQAEVTVVSVTYEDPEITVFSYGDVAASGGAATPTITYKQKKVTLWSNETTTEEWITSGADLSITKVSGADGIVVSVANVNNIPASTETSRHEVAKVKLKVTINGMSSERTATVYQKAYVVIDNWYVGQITKSKAEYAALSADVLVANAEAIPTTTKSKDFNINKSIFYMMLPEGTTAKSAQWTSGGLTSTFTAEEIVDPNEFRCTHEDVTIGGKTYKVYAYRDAGFIDSNTPANIKIN